MINGKLLRDAIISGANNIYNERQRVDALNVFPVPDGDTGTNMSMTMNAAKTELLTLPDNLTVAEVAHKTSSALLRGARGNSGVITSLLFRGFSKGLKDKETATVEDLKYALSLGVAAAYKAVMKPTEGTMLTVARIASENLTNADTSNMSTTEAWNFMLEQAEKTLAETPEMLPVLKKAGVVDAGGAGICCIYKGMQSVFNGNGIIAVEGNDTTATQNVKVEDIEFIDEFDGGEIVFGYCTEFIVLKDKEHEKDPLLLRAYLESIGDSVVAVDDDDIIKCHVHTNDPGLALQEALKFGMLTKMKIENMREQFADRQKQKKAESLKQVPVDPDVPFSFVAVAAGSGVENLFTDLGATHIVSGGQTMNPSTSDILTAIEACPSQNVFVLPNNKNIIMSSEQAIKLTTRNVVVIPTRTIPQGLSAMLNFDPDADMDTNTINMKNAIDNVGTGQITFAARDSDYDGHKIKKGELLALENGKVSFTETDLVKCAVKLTKALLKKDSSFVTLIYGEDVTDEQAAEIESAINEKLPSNIDCSLVNGGQPVYYLTISVE